jgi:hypothetical protein
MIGLLANHGFTRPPTCSTLCRNRCMVRPRRTCMRSTRRPRRRRDRLRPLHEQVRREIRQGGDLPRQG